MRKLFLSCFLFASAIVYAQDVNTQYARLQEAYSERLQDLETRHSSQQREILHQCILALVRTEQGYREEGNLDGVVMTREIRDTLLQEAVVPPVEDTWPIGLQKMIAELDHRKTEIQNEIQTELDQLNQMLFRALEPYKIEFTRQGEVETAIEVRTLQEKIAQRLGLEHPSSKGDAPVITRSSTDPNAYLFLLEPAAFQNKRRVPERKALVELTPALNGEVRLEEKGYLFDSGSLTLPSVQSEPMRANAARNQMLALELGIRTPWSSQGNTSLPAAIFLWGSSLDEANLAIAQEGTDLYLYVKTSTPPPGRKNHRVSLGPLPADEPTHLIVTYKANEFIVYRNGVATRRIRGSIKGSFSTWEASDAFLGRLPPSDRMPTPTPWYGHLHQLGIKAGQDVSRRVVDFYIRFQRALEE